MRPHMSVHRWGDEVRRDETTLLQILSVNVALWYGAVSYHVMSCDVMSSHLIGDVIQCGSG